MGNQLGRHHGRFKKKKKKGRNGKRPGVSKEQRGIWIWLESQAVHPLQGSHAKDAEG